MLHHITLTLLRDLAVTLIALGTVAGAIWRMWGRPAVQFFIARREAEERWRARIDMEFENGVPALLPDGTRNPAYTPLRKAVDAHSVKLQEHIMETKPLTDQFLKEHPDLRRDPPMGAI